jgi:eukaryotic-like serine/threonine-protein kinase
MIWSVGQSLQQGRYVVEKVLDTGRLSVTYLAATPQGHGVVIKTPNESAMQRVDFDRLQERFVREAFLLAKCRHPHIVRVEPPFQEQGVWCIPMEYVAGTTLDMAMRDRQQLPEAEAITYIRQIGEALAELHKQDLLHRDINPGNIMLRTRDGGATEAVLIDFGLARDFRMEMTQHTQRSEDLTSGFRAPELDIPGGDRGPYTDLYALGATLYNLVTGQQPPSAAELKNRALQFSSGVSLGMQKAIQQAMAQSPSDRPDSVKIWLDTLPSTSQAKAPSVESEEQRKKRIENGTYRLAILGAIVALVAAIGTFLSGISDYKEKWTPSTSQTGSSSAQALK